MKKFIIAVVLFCSISARAQENSGTNDILMEAKKDYLYHLAQLNTADYGNKYKTYLRFIDYGNYSPNPENIRSVLQRVPVFQKMKVKLQIEQTDFLIFEIKLHIEKSPHWFLIQADGTHIEQVDSSKIDTLYEHGTKSMEVHVYFVLLKNTSGFTKKSGEGEIIPSKPPNSYRWVLKDNLLIFISTTAFPKAKLHQHVYLPQVE